PRGDPSGGPRPLRAGSSQARLLNDDRRMMLPLALLLACREPPPSRPNFLVVDLDTLRADRIFRERNGESLTPHIDALTTRAVYFEAAIAQSGWTLPSLAALLTGRLPLGALERVPARDVEWMLPDA